MAEGTQEKEKSGLPALIGAIAAVIVAITGLIAVLMPKPEPTLPSSAAAPSSTPPAGKDLLAIRSNTEHAGAHALKGKVDDTEYVSQPYTTEGDGRQTKTLTCPKGKIIVPGTPKCMNTGGNPTISSEQIGQNTYRCQWKYQEVGIGIWVEMACKSPQ